MSLGLQVVDNFVVEMMNDIPAGFGALPRSFKMHSSMCLTLRHLAIRIMSIFPDIEAARPGCSSGIHTLCLLNIALEKTKLLLQYCSESSKLYMAVTGDAILSRSLRVKKLLEQHLREIQKMVPVVLAVKISDIIHDLRSAEFTLDVSEEEAGKAVSEMMRRKVSSSVSLDGITEFHFAAWKLQLSSPNAVINERKSLKALLMKLGEDNLHKRKILRYLLYLLQKHEEFITGDGKENSFPWQEESSAVRCSTEDSVSGNASQVEWSEVGVNIEDPGKQSKALHHRDFSSISIASFGSSLCNFQLPSDISSISIGGSEPNCSGHTPALSKVSKGSDLMPMSTIDDDSGSCQTGLSQSEVEIEILCGLADLPWEAQREVIERARSDIEHDSQVFRSLSLPGFLEPLIAYLKNAHDLHCVEDIRAGLDLLLMFLSKNRRAIESLNEDAFRLLSNFLDSEAAPEALNVLEVLSGYPHGVSRLTSSCSLSSLLKIFESQTGDLQDKAIITLKNLSSSNKICLEMVSLRFTQKLTYFLQHDTLRKHALIILRNLCYTEKGSDSVATTDGCLASVAELLESGSHEEQENTIAILLKLCMKTEYCYLVMDEGINVIPSLVFISKNGSDEAKASAFELLRVLHDVDFGKGQGSSSREEPETLQEHDTNSVQAIQPQSHKKSGIFRFKIYVPGLKKKIW
ncbi:PREDICTED: U-box domain-containing protein 5-like [Tarenaya hassleriana]|uniref:U-box domain-containing protein 5-like n=1 Tax=Tarenaya hassleriana TaxID=28532 RepID=UPI00053C98B1|nr:PREDICTED: U-box domain-containing protein 5-like [Tarenaya hassleriana]